MCSLYHNSRVGNRVNAIKQLDRLIHRPDGEYEVVVSLTVGTDYSVGMITANLSLDEVGEGQGMMPQYLGFYPMSQQSFAQEDAILVARQFGLRLRRATPGIGWEWVPTATTIATLEPQGIGLQIG